MRNRSGDLANGTRIGRIATDLATCSLAQPGGWRGCGVCIGTPGAWQPRTEVYVPMSQLRVLGGELVIRTSGDPYAVLPAVKSAVLAVRMALGATRSRALTLTASAIG